MAERKSEKMSLEADNSYYDGVLDALLEVEKQQEVRALSAWLNQILQPSKKKISTLSLK